MFKTNLALIFAVVFASHAQLLTSRFTTSFYGWQGIDSARSSTLYARGYEQVHLNIANEQFQFLTNFQVSNDFGTAIALDPELRISSLMVKGNNIGGVADISVGRQFVYAGVGSGIMDGYLLERKFFDNTFGITAYGGLNVIRTRDWNLNQSLTDNSMYGALLSYSPIENGAIGISYMSKLWKRESYSGIRPNLADSSFDPQYVVFYSRPNEEEFTSIDLLYDSPESFNVYARSDYDMIGEKFSRAQISAKYFVVKNLSIAADYLFHEPRLAYNSIFSVFNFGSTKELEGSVEYQILPKTRLFARFANVSYVDDNSQRLSIGGMYDFLTFNYTKNFGFAGDLNGINVFAVYPLQDLLLTPSVGFGYASYKLSKEAPSNSVLSLLAGVTYRPMKMLMTDFQLQWMNNPQFKNDLRVFIKASYYLSDKLNLL